MRAFVQMALALLPVATAAAASDSGFDFDVLLDARPIGTHNFRIQLAADGMQQVSSVAEFDVKVLGVVIYRYRHQATERWEQGCLTQMQATTSDNGRQLRVTGEVRGGRFQVIRANQSVARDGCVISYAYWDPARLLRQQELLNPQTGEFDAVQIESLGEERIDVSGAPTEADRYRLRNGKLAIDLWYSKAGEWLQLESTTDSKRLLRYRLRNRPPSQRGSGAGRNAGDEQRAGLPVFNQ